MTSWLLGAVLTGAVLVLAAQLAERALAGLGLPRRWPWVVALVAGAGLPLVGRWLPVLPTGKPQTLQQVLALLNGAPVTRVAVAAGTDWTRWAGGAWLLASAVLLLILVYTGLRLARARRGWVAAEVEGGGVLVSAGSGPAVVGLLRPAVVVPAWVISAPADARRMVLAHEREHVRAGDPWLLAGAALVTALLPWNPALWWVQRRLRLALESDCDARVLASGVDRSSYGALLLRTAAQGRSWAPTLALVESKTSLERRIRAMTRKLPRNRAYAALTLGAAAVLALLACDLAAPTGERDVLVKKAPARAQSAERTPVSTVPARPTHEVTVNSKTGEVLSERVRTPHAHGAGQGAEQPLAVGAGTVVHVRTAQEADPGPGSMTVSHMDRAHVYLDGKVVPSDVIKTLDPATIASISVLKNEAAARFLGKDDDGAAVIQITLKH